MTRTGCSAAIPVPTASPSERSGRWRRPSQSCFLAAAGCRCAMCTRACSRRWCRARRCPTTGSRSPIPAAGETISDDPYRHLPTLGEIDLHLIAEGRHEALWTVLGARVRPEAGGTSFAVWAPNARGVRVIGDFNHWDGRAHPMRSLGGSGVWELLVPGVGAGATYKFDICGAGRHLACQGRPDGRRAEQPPATASRGDRVRLHVGRRGVAGRSGPSVTCWPAR